MTTTSLHTTENRAFIHRFSSHEKTLCGQDVRRPKPNPPLRTTRNDDHVTCRRCLKSMTLIGQSQVAQDPEWVRVFREGITQIADAIKTSMSLQARMSRVIGMIADANKTGDGLMLNKDEVDALATLIYLLNAGNKS